MISAAGALKALRRFLLHSYAGKGRYTGVTKAEYRIDPKGTSLKKPGKAKKTVIVKWKKQSAKMAKSRITGYQIQLATDSRFTGKTKTVNVRGYKKVIKKVKKT